MKKQVAKEADAKTGGWFSWFSSKKEEDAAAEEEKDPLVVDGEANEKTEEEKKDDDDAETKEAVTTFKNMTGLWDIDPDDSDW